MTPNPKPATAVETMTLVLSFSIGNIRKTAQVKREKVRTMEQAIREIDRAWDEPEEDVINVSKELFDNPKVKALSDYLGATRAILRGGGQPVRFLRRGLYLYSLAKVEWAEAKIAEAQAEIDAQLAVLESEWADIIESERKRLEPLGLFDQSDYPSIARIREATRIKFTWARFSAPTGDLKGLPADLIRREREKAAAMWTDIADEIRVAHRQMMNDFVDGLLDTLRPGEDGKTRILRQARIERFAEFLRDFPLQNVTRDTELADLAEKARGLLRGVDAEVLRSEPKASRRVEEGLTSIQMELKALVVDAPRRVVLK